MRPARFRHRPGRRGDHERLHVHGLLLGHLPCGCDSGALRRGARLLRDGLRRPARSRHRAHARRHPRGHRRTHGRLRPSVRRTRFGERPLEARDGAAERVRSRHRLSRRRPLVRRDISGTSLRVGGRLHRLLVSRREKPDDGRRRRACMARGRVRFRRAVPPVHVAVAARPDEGRAGEEPRGRLGVRHRLPRVEVQHDRHSGGPRPRAAAPLPRLARPSARHRRALRAHAMSSC